MYNKGNQTEFKTSMIRSNLCGFSYAYILISGTITIDGWEDDDAAKRAILKTCVSFTECISNINNTEIDNAKDIDVAMPMYKLIEYSHNHSKTSRSVWQYYEDEPSDQIVISKSFESNIKITWKTPDNDNKINVKIMVPLKYLSNS